MKKSILSILVIISVLAVALLAACGTPAASPAATAPATTAAPQTFALKYAMPYPENDEMYIGPKYMFAEMDKRTSGRVKVTPYFSESLGKVTDSLDMLNKGVADIAMVNPDLFQKQFPTFTAPLIAALGSPNRATTQEAMYTLWNTGLLKKDLTGWKLLLMEATDVAGIGLKKKVTTLEELQKLKVRTPPGNFAKSMEAAGVPTVNIPAPDVYMSIDRGVADGTVTMPGSYFSLKIPEVAKYWLMYPMGVGCNMFIMTQAKWDSLPKDIQLTWEQVSEETKYVFLEGIDQKIPDRLAEFKKQGADPYFISAEETAKWQKLMTPVLDKYIADQEAAGFPAKAAVESIKRTVARYKQ